MTAPAPPLAAPSLAAVAEAVVGQIAACRYWMVF